MRTNCRDPFLLFSGDFFSIRPNHPLSILIWRLPPSFCGNTVYAISADGKISGTLHSPHNSGPLCLFSHPFAKRYEISSSVGEPEIVGNLSVKYYVGSLYREFSTCLMGIECLFLHSEPFLLKIEWKTGKQFNIDLKFQTDSMKHSDRPCFLGAIPNGDGEILSNAETFTFECQDKEEQEYRQLVTVFLTVLGVLGFAIVLHATGFVNMKVALGCEDENIRFEKIRQDLQIVKNPWPPFMNEEDEGP
jgi:hypothetical protein